MAKLFGTDGIRGEAGMFPLDAETVFKIGRSLAERVGERVGRQVTFLTGRDTRESGTWIELEFSRGAASAGAECVSAAVITTPGVAFLTSLFRFDLGIVISASHNPFQDNGIKAFLPSGKKIDVELEKLVEADVAAGRTAENLDGKFVIKNEKASDFRLKYQEHLLNATSAFRLDGYRIVVDCANGAACGLATHLLRQLGAEVIAIHDRPDGGNINENCGSLHLEHLQQKVIDVQADMGVAFDGDADRSLFVDEKGNIIDGDAVLWILGKRMHDRGELKSGKVIATVMSNIGLEIALRSRNIELVRTPVGDKYVLDELLRSGAEIGGEQSGHIIFPHDSLVGDGMMSALRVFEAVSLSGLKFSELTAGFTRYPQVLINVKVVKKSPFDEVDAIRTASAAVEKALAGNGRLLLRYSGTENLARVMIEGRDQQEIDGLANSLAQTIQAELN